MIPVGDGGAVDGHHRVADVLVEIAAAAEHGVAHRRQVEVQELDQLLWREVLGDRREVADVREEDREFPARAAEGETAGIGEELVQGLTAEVLAEGAPQPAALLGLAGVGRPEAEAAEDDHRAEGPDDAQPEVVDGEGDEGDARVGEREGCDAAEAEERPGVEATDEEERREEAEEAAQAGVDEGGGAADRIAGEEVVDRRRVELDRRELGIEGGPRPVVAQVGDADEDDLAGQLVAELSVQHVARAVGREGRPDAAEVEDHPVAVVELGPAVADPHLAFAAEVGDRALGGVVVGGEEGHGERRVDGVLVAAGEDQLAGGLVLIDGDRDHPEGARGRVEGGERDEPAARRGGRPGADERLIVAALAERGILSEGLSAGAEGEAEDDVAGGAEGGDEARVACDLSGDPLEQAVGRVARVGVGGDLPANVRLELLAEEVLRVGEDRVDPDHGGLGRSDGVDQLGEGGSPLEEAGVGGQGGVVDGDDGDRVAGRRRPPQLEAEVEGQAFEVLDRREAIAEAVEGGEGRQEGDEDEPDEDDPIGDSEGHGRAL